jgi:6-phosphogluconate dehydrogenase
MRFGIIGLGRIGGALGRQALEKGHQVVGYARSPESTRFLAAEGLEPAWSLDEVITKLPSPRILLIYVPHGEPTDQEIADIKSRLDKGDVLLDGGNSHWRDSIRHFEDLRKAGFQFLDVGTSGGVTGARHGACFMSGGDAEAFTRAEPLLRSLAVPDGVVTPAPRAPAIL